MSFSTLIRFLLQKEPSALVKRNVVVICQITFLLMALVLYNVFNGDYQSVLPDLLIMTVAGAMWWSIKRYDTYYSGLMFVFMLPVLLVAGYQGVADWGAAGMVWFFPIVVLYFFCLPERLAWVSSFANFSVAAWTSCLYLPTDHTFRLLLSLAMVSLCCAMIFRSLYKQNQVLRYQATRDALTGAHNRRLLEDVLLRAAQLADHAELPPALLCIDADNFKRINDTYGHHIGDRVLQVLAKAMRSELSHVDDKLFRLGGEEFLMLVNGRSFDGVTIFAEYLTQKISNLDVLPNDEQITVSIGVAVYSPPATWTQWMRQADHAMYMAKSNGKNQVSC